MTTRRLRALFPIAALSGCLLLIAACPDDAVPLDGGAADQGVDSPVGDQGAPDGPAGPDTVATPDTAVDSAPSPDVGPDIITDDQPSPPVDAAVASPDLPQGGCNLAKIDFTQANPKKYELFEFCFPAGDTLTEAQAKILEPGLTCSHSAGGIAAKCTAGQWRCYGGLDREPSGAIKALAWERLCLLSQLPKLVLIKGGHYL